MYSDLYDRTLIVTYHFVDERAGKCLRKKIYRKDRVTLYIAYLLCPFYHHCLPGFYSSSNIYNREYNNMELSPLVEMIKKYISQHQIHHQTVLWGPNTGLGSSSTCAPELGSASQFSSCSHCGHYIQCYIVEDLFVG